MFESDYTLSGCIFYFSFLTLKKPGNTAIVVYSLLISTLEVTCIYLSVKK